MIEELRNKAEQAKILYRSNVIDRKEAEKDIKPHLKVANDKSKELAKKYNQKPRLISMAAYLR